jgi:uncharacterized protein DUF6636
MLSRTVILLAVGVALTASVAACDGSSKARDATPTTTGGTTAVVTAASPAAPDPTAPDTADTTAVVPPAPVSSAPVPPTHERKVSDRFFGFYAPSKNIMCLMSQDGSWHGVRCDVREKNWKLPSKPANCPYDFGNGIELGRTAQLHCATDSIVDEVHTTAAYGDAFTAGDLRCEVTKAGVRCDNTATGHGFTASRETYRLY